MSYPEYKEDFNQYFATPLSKLGLNAAEAPDGQLLMIGPMAAVIAQVSPEEFHSLLRVPSQPKPIIVWDLARFLLPEEKIVWGGYSPSEVLGVRGNMIKMMEIQAAWIAGPIAPVFQGATDLLDNYQAYIVKRAQYYTVLDKHLPQGHALRNAFTQHGYMEAAEAYFRENGIDPNQ